MLFQGISSGAVADSELDEVDDDSAGASGRFVYKFVRKRRNVAPDSESESLLGSELVVGEYVTVSVQGTEECRTKGAAANQKLNIFFFLFRRTCWND